MADKVKKAQKVKKSVKPQDENTNGNSNGKEEAGAIVAAVTVGVEVEETPVTTAVGSPVNTEELTVTKTAEVVLPEVSTLAVESEKLPCENPRPRHTGTVRWFCKKKGFGFIAPDGQPTLTDRKGKPVNDIFVHYSNIQRDGYKILNDGERVEYDLCAIPGKSNLMAVKVASLDVA